MREKNRKRDKQINVRLVNNEKDYLKWTSKASSMSHKLADFGMFILELS